MSTNESRGLEIAPNDSSTAHSQWNYSELGEAIDALERVDWTSVPTIQVSEAEEIHARLREAREELGQQTYPASHEEGI